MWKPITQNEFRDLLKTQSDDMTDQARRAFVRFSVPVYTAKIRRSKEGGDEDVFVVANSPKGVVYFDDVEYGFNFSPIDENGRLTDPGGSQMSLEDASHLWLLPQLA